MTTEAKMTPPPSEKDAWLAKCAARYIERGALDTEDAFICANNAWDEAIYRKENPLDLDPAEQADDDMEYWDNDGD